MQNTTCNQSQRKRRLQVPRFLKLCRALLPAVPLLLVPSAAIGQKSEGIEPCPSSSARVNSSSTIVYGGAVAADASRTAIDTAIPDDPNLLEMIEPYRSRVRRLENVIGKLEGDLRKSGVGAGSLGNFITDGMRVEATRIQRKPVALAITNSGGLRRSTIGKGSLRVRDIFELLPFENALITIDLGGRQVLNLLSAVVASNDAQSGARIIHRSGQDNRPEVVSAKFVDAKGRERPIDPNAIYTVVTTDYLHERGSGRYSMLREGKNVKPLGITLREAILNYVKSETAAGRQVRANLDARFVEINRQPRKENSQ